MTDVFISYSGRAGEKIANAFHTGFPEYAKQAGIPESDMKVFVAHRSISGGAEWEKVIWDNLRQCKWFFFVVTAESNNSHYAQQELGGAIALHKPIIPLLGEGVPADDLPGFIKGRQAVDLSGTQDKIAEMIGDVIEMKKAEIRGIQEKRQKEQTENTLWTLAGIAAGIAFLLKK